VALGGHRGVMGVMGTMGVMGKGSWGRGHGGLCKLENWHAVSDQS
jgi:hypothetical protein